MIRKFIFKNFYSFLDETVIDLKIKNAPDTNSYFKDSSGDRLTKLIAFIGPNASGKTNLLKCLSFLAWFISDSFSDLKPNEEIDVKPFLFCSNIKPSKFTIEFETNKKIYLYELEITTKKILFEKLNVKEKKRFKLIFQRSWNNKSNKYDFNFKRFNLPVDFYQRTNATLISAGQQINNKICIEVVQYLNKINTNLSERGRIPTERFPDVIKYYAENPEIKEWVEQILSKFDLGFSKIIIEKIETEDKRVIYLPKGSHKYVDSKKEYLLPFHYESAGTKNLLFILRTISKALKEGGIAVLDELDNDLHPLMMPEILHLFTSKTTNPNNAQLLFSTHNVQILNELDKQQIVLVEKNKNNISEAWKLSDLKGVRADDNFFSKYMSGAYGAIPKL